MKRTVFSSKKVLTAVLASTLLMTACSTKEGPEAPANGDDPDISVEETTEPAPTEPEGDVIIPLYKSEYEDLIRESSPLDLFYFDTFCEIFPVSKAKTDDNGRQLYQLEYGNSFDLKYSAFSLATGYSLEGTDPETTTNVELYFRESPYRYLLMDSVVDGKSDSVDINFVPLFYNQTKGCLAGYYVKYEDGLETEIHFREVFHGYIEALEFDVDTTDLANTKVLDVSDPGKYGFTAFPSIDAPTSDVIVPLYKPEFEDEIRTISPAELNDFDNFNKYFPVETISSDDNGFTICELQHDGALKLRNRYYQSDEEKDAIFNVEYYSYGRSGDALGGFYVEEGSTPITEMSYLPDYYDISKGKAFIPLFYNETKGCFVGFEPVNMEAEYHYPTYNGSGYAFVELYRGQYEFDCPVNPARYGF